ncbi:MAG: VOC family protein [Pseudomonadota bacterium]|nr:VOC family protein [Pseudomonadota bacterium]
MENNDAVPPNARFTHFGFWVTNLQQMAEFYQNLFKMHRTDEGHIEGHDLKADLVFLTRDPMVHHQIVLIGGKPEEISFNVINQISFLLESLSDLRKFWEILKMRKDVSDVYALTHGNAWSIYFKDPEGNRIELYVDTDWYVGQPFREVLDFNLTDAEIIEKTRAIVMKYASYEPINQWRQGVANSIGLKSWSKNKD